MKTGYTVPGKGRQESQACGIKHAFSELCRGFLYPERKQLIDTTRRVPCGSFHSHRVLACLSPTDPPMSDLVPPHHSLRQAGQSPGWGVGRTLVPENWDTEKYSKATQSHRELRLELWLCMEEFQLPIYGLHTQANTTLNTRLD